MKRIFVVLGFVTIAGCRGGTDTGTISSSSNGGTISSSSGGSSGGASSGTGSSGGVDTGFECPTVGEKNCPNDEPATQSSVDVCERCRSEFGAYVSCLGGTPPCGSDGKTSSTTKPECQEQQDAVVQCALASTDGGR